VKIKKQLLAGLTALILNGPASAASLTYGSSEAFISGMEQLLQGTRTSDAGGPAPRAVLVYDTVVFKKHIRANKQVTVMITAESAPEPTSWFPLLKIDTPKPRERASSGSGAIVTKDGYIVTNNHVVEGAVKITVTLIDKREFPAKLIGVDPATDMAVVKIDGVNLPTIRWGNSDNLEVGDLIVAIGAPMGLDQTVTSGIVSSIHRKIKLLEYEDFIQIDAALNPGNSGGPLFHGETGEFLGLNNSIVSQTGSFNGIGLTIPAAVVKEISAVLIKSGKIVRSIVGISTVELTSTRRAELGVPPGIQGVLVEDVAADGPNAKSGLAAKDVIVGFNAVSITNRFQLRMAIARMPPGSIVPMTVWRKGQTVNVNVTCAPRG
jgi:S1-C subfamily serine protease